MRPPIIVVTHKSAVTTYPFNYCHPHQTEKNKSIDQLMMKEKSV